MGRVATAPVLAALLTMPPAADGGTASNAEKEKVTSALTISLSSESARSGGVLINLYVTGTGFPARPEHAVTRVNAPVDRWPLVVRIPDVPYGMYALAVCHDVNGNGTCDQNFLGIPTEPVGVSRNAKGFLGPPRFNDARFSVGKPEIALAVSLK